MNPVTGPQSTSFKVAAGGFFTGLLTMASSFINNPDATVSSAQAAVTDGRLAVGGAVALFSLLGKLYHDHGLNAATANSGGAAIAAAFPAVEANAKNAVTAIEQVIPGLRSAISDATARVSKVEAAIAAPVQAAVVDATQVEAVVNRVLAQKLGTAPAAAPAGAAPVA